MWLTKAHTSQEAPTSTSGSSSHYPKHCANNWDAIEDFIYDIVLPKKIVLQNWDSIKEKLSQDTIILKKILDKINPKYSTVLYE
ncbi:barstar family protein [Fusobacterium pseudoperiodonticum]|uniref:Barstar (barnase inhibitor) domain-containing protein n=1 Tax=Fusobacterium pseudoperiodonticum TaxID=2663009 RepID=A0A2D3NV72_9FUSO|nr:barstar family protein [Fusobacterium pseudoperiodonticum]ATV59305.1 hypothetical protein CTM72_05865 [Fusobacterium pseudoperiodonticum]